MDNHLTPNQPVKWGILGPGDIAAPFAEALRRTPGAECVAVGSRSPERARRFAMDHAIPRAYGSYDKLVRDPEVEVVYVATPQAFHHRHGRLALENGRGVLIEKPLAMTGAEVEDLVALATQRGLFLMEGLWTLCNPLVRQLASLVQSGKHGQLLAMLANCGPLALPHDHRALDASVGGAFYREVLVYPLAMWLALSDLALIDDVQASGSFSTGTDYAASTLLTTRDGRFASMGGSFAAGVTTSTESRAHLLLTDGWAELDDVFKPTRLRVAHGDRVEVDILTDDTVDFEYEITEAVEAIKRRRIESSSVPHSLSLALADLLDRVAAQLHSRKVSHATD